MTHAHRRAYELAHGPIPAGLDILHSCDNRACCNPAHLSAGTPAQNSREMVERGRSGGQTGAHDGRRHLTAEQVREIRDLATAGVSQAAIARQFGVSQPHIFGILHGKTWKGLDRQHRCLDCGTELDGLPSAGHPALRCASCRTAHERRRDREWYTRKRSVA